jgi:hypothetical protein
LDACKHVVCLEDITVASQTDDAADEIDKTLLAGLGAKAMCAAARALLRMEPDMHPDSTCVYLQAKGSLRPASRADMELVEQLRALPDAEKRARVMTVFARDPGSSGVSDTWMHRLMNAQRTRQLVNYYTTTFGFETLTGPHVADMVTMSTSLVRIMDACEKVVRRTAKRMRAH